MNPFMRLAIVLPAVCLLGGCWDRTELNDLALVTALALDKAEKNQIQVTVQVLIPQNQNGEGKKGGGGKGTIVRSEKGSNISDALFKLQRKMPRKIFWGQCKTFLFSTALAEAGLHEHVDFLVRHPQIRSRAYVLISKEKASTALEIFPPIERSSAEVLRELTNLKIGIQVTVEQLSNMLRGNSQSGLLPLIDLPPQTDSTESSQLIPYFYKSAVFKKDKMVGVISEKVTRGAMWIKNDINDNTVTLKVDGTKELISLRPVKADVRLIPEIKGDNWLMTIKVRTKGDIVQNGSELNFMNPDYLAILSKEFENEVKEHIRLATYEAQHRLKADIFDFAKEFHRKYPKKWEEIKKKWDEKFPHVEVNIEVEANIDRPGHINLPGGMPKEEVKEK